MADNSEFQHMQEQLRDMKPCFSMTNSKVFVNLHILSCKKAAEAVKLNAGDENINQFIINTGITEDGRYISSKLRDNDYSQVGKAFQLNGGKYEMGIVLQFTEFKSPTNQEIKDNGDDIWKAIWEVNKDEEKKLRNLVFKGIQEYFKWFAEINIGSPDDLIPFVPSYDGGRIKLNGGQINGMNQNEAIEYMTHRRKDGSSDEEAGEFPAPRFGYKIGYTITY